MANTQIKVSVLSDLSKFDLSKANKELDNLGTGSDKSAGKLSKLGGGIQKMALPAAAAIGGIGLAVKGFIGGAEEAASAQAALNNVFEQMGYKENAKAASDYADQLSKVTNYDDETIRLAQTKLATFEQVAKSTELMGRATKISADLSAAGFGEMSSTSVQVGKALQDPIKGVSALARVGVTFSDEQKKMIKTLVETGREAEAQNIIMEALETQVGGTAEATADSSVLMSHALGEVGESIGTALLPAFQKLTDIAIKFADWAQNNTGLIITLGAVIGGIAAAVIAVNAAMKVYQAITAIVAAANYIMGTSFTVALGPIGLIIAAIAAVIAIGVLLYKNWDKISEFLKKVWEGIKDVAVKVWNAIKDFFVALWDGIKGAGEKIWNSIKDFAIAVWDGIKRGLEAIWEGIKTAVTAYFNFYKTVIETVWNAVKTVVTTVWNGIKDFLTGVWDKIKELATTAFNGLKTVITNIVGNVFDFLKELPGRIINLYVGFYKLLWERGKELITGLWNGIKEMWTTARDWLSDIPSKVLSAVGNVAKLLFEKGKDIVRGLIDGIKSMASSVVSAITNLIPGPLRSVVSSLFRSADLASMNVMSVPSMEVRDGTSSIFSGYTYTMPSSSRAVQQVQVNYNVTVESMVADRRAGTLIVDAIKEYERTAGGAWRA